MRIVSPEESKDLVLSKGERVFCSVYKNFLVPVVITSAAEAFSWYESRSISFEDFVGMIEEKIKTYHPSTEKVVSIKAEVWNDATKRYSSV